MNENHPSAYPSNPFRLKSIVKLRSVIPIFFMCSLPFLQVATAAAKNKQIIAYIFPKDRIIAPQEISATKLTRINYAFANLHNGEIVEGFAHDAENFAVLNSLKRDNPSLTVVISVGGWTWSG